MIIELSDYQIALGLLLDAEAYMSDIFSHMMSGGDSAVIDEAYHFLTVIYAKEGKPVLQHRLIHFLRERVPSSSVLRILEVMEKSNLIRLANYQTQDGKIIAAYSPVPKPT